MRYTPNNTVDTGLRQVINRGKLRSQYFSPFEAVQKCQLVASVVFKESQDHTLGTCDRARFENCRWRWFTQSPRVSRSCKTCVIQQFSLLVTESGATKWSFRNVRGEQKAGDHPACTMHRRYTELCSKERVGCGIRTFKWEHV